MESAAYAVKGVLGILLSFLLTSAVIFLGCLGLHEPFKLGTVIYAWLTLKVMVSFLKA